MERLDLINSYINGKLSAEEAKSLESALNQDESLRNLLEQETLMKDAVSRYRTIELKARMNNIKVTSGVSNYLKIAASLMIMGGVISGGYYYKSISSHNNNNLANNQQSNLSVENKPTIKDQNTKEVISETLKKEEVSTHENSADKKMSVKKQNANTNNSISSPSVEDIDAASPSDFNDSENKSVNSDNTGSINGPKTDISIELNNSEELRYKNFNSKLFLIGKFTKKYEIIAVKSDEMYLSYNGNFYYLRNNVETSTKLEKVTNIALLKTLNNQLRNHSN